MEMVDMDIRIFWISGPKSRSVSIFFSIVFNEFQLILINFNGFLILSTPVRCVGVPAGLFFVSEKMTSLKFVDMYFVIFDMNNQYFIELFVMNVSTISVY